MDLFDIYVKLSVDESDYKRAVQDAKKESKNLTTEFQNLARHSGSLQDNIDDLGKAHNASKRKVDALRDALAKAVEETGDDSEETKRLSKELASAQKEEEEIAQKLEKGNEKLDDQDKKAEKAKESWKKFGNGLKNVAVGVGAAIGAISAGVIAIGKSAIDGYAEYEQLVGGVGKIFDEIDQTAILKDAQAAYKNLNMSASEYLTSINNVGAAFSATMGDEAAYDTAKRGMQAIADFASGTGKNVSELNDKYMMITRSTGSYQSIADQFSGILPATSEAFLKQAQAADLLSNKYKSLTEVPISEYQQAVTLMLEQGVADLGLTNNTLDESFKTLSGSMAATKSAWKNLLAGFADDDADLDFLIGNFMESIMAVGSNIVPAITKMLPKIAEGLTKIVNTLVPQLPGIISGMLPGLIQGASSILQSLATSLPQLITVLVDQLPVLVDAMLTALPLIIKAGMEMLFALILGMAEALPTIIPNIVEVILQIVEYLIDNVDLLIDAAIALMFGLATGLVDAIPILIEKVPEIIVAFVGALIENLPSILQAGSDLIVGLGTGIWNGLVSLFTKIGGWIYENIIQPIADKLPELVQKGKDFMTNLGTGISEGLKTIFSSIGGWVQDNIVQPIKDKVTEFRNVGKNLLEGLWNGINDKVEWLKGKVRGVVDKIKSWFTGKDGFDEGSPSKWAKQVFAYVMEGGAIGISVGESGLVQTANAAIKRVKGIISGDAAELQLNASVNAATNSGGNNGIVINQYIESVPQTPVELASATAAYFEQARWAT